MNTVLQAKRRLVAMIKRVMSQHMRPRVLQRKSAQYRGHQVPRARRRQPSEASAARRVSKGVVNGLTESLEALGFLKLGDKTDRVDGGGGAK